MGLFDEIRKALEEAAEEARQQGRPVPERAAPVDEDQAQARRQRAFARQAAEANAQAAAEAAAEQARRVSTAANQVKNHAATIQHAAPVQPRTTSPERIRQLLRQPRSMREIIVLSEVLARPLALKRR